MTCRKAIIPVAGYGTRRLPVTKAIEKAMLPVLNRPIIDYVVEDCIKAGVEEIIFVVSEGGAVQLEAYYSHNKQLEAYLEEHNKGQLTAAITPPPNVTFAYVVQNPEIGYGTAVPVALCRDLIPEGESALVLMGDDFLYREDGGSDVADMLKAAVGEGSDAMLGVAVAKERVSHYGVLRIRDGKFVEIIEKPSPQAAPSNLINVSKYVMSSKLLDYVVDYTKEEVEGEYLITEPINRFVSDGGVVQVHANKGEYCDGGTLEGWVAANNYLYGVATK